MYVPNLEKHATLIFCIFYVYLRPIYIVMAHYLHSLSSHCSSLLMTHLIFLFNFTLKYCHLV